MMALAEAINDTPVFGLLAGHCQIKKCFQGLVTQHVSLAQVEIAAHTFHYGSFTTPLAIAFQATSKNGNGEAAYQHCSITASFLHFYFASNPQVTASLFLAKGLGMRFLTRRGFSSHATRCKAYGRVIFKPCKHFLQRTYAG